MTFHQRVEEVAAFAEELPETAAELYVTDASDADLAAAASGARSCGSSPTASTPPGTACTGRSSPP
ncbi:hypothetical protein ACFWJT_23090 [Streptomyces sp. NPDC127069]|uniref:hypothetical protein n=1 Tax=Streptomyces sp. NPDC127069 TaxID=3347128 RepID=UPI0036595E72